MRVMAWRTDEPCPSCGNGLTVVDDGGPVLRAECRLCGHAETWECEADLSGGDNWW
jgi:hypothetical protein